MSALSILVTISLDSDRRGAVEAACPVDVELRLVDELHPDDQPPAVAAADGLLSFAPHRELTEEAFAELHAGHVIQTISAGVDHLPFDRFPDGMTIQSNAGAYAEPMAEHAVAFYLALCKRLPIEHRRLTEGEFNQFTKNRLVEGSTCVIFGFGATGAATARRLQTLGVEVLAINRSGETEEPVDFLGTPADLNELLARADGLVIAAPLTPATRGIIDRATLRRLPEDGFVVNVARGELIDQQDLYEHLHANPRFQAGIDAWWTEPLRHGEFKLEYPLLSLPNVFGSPHNSARVPGVSADGARRAIENLVATCQGAAPKNRVDPALGY